MVSFAVCTDLHYDIVPDGDERMESSYQKTTPSSLGIASATWDGRGITPRVSSFSSLADEYSLNHSSGN